MVENHQKSIIFKVSEKCQNWPFFDIFNDFLSTQNVNVARFARNVKCDFFCDFQTLWLKPQWDLWYLYIAQCFEMTKKSHLTLRAKRATDNWYIGHNLRFNSVW